MYKSKRIGAILVNYHTTQEVIHMAKTYESFDVIDSIVIVNNDTKDSEIEELLTIKSEKIHIICEDDNLGYSKGNNQGIHLLLKDKEKPDYIIISNSDIEVNEEAITTTLECMEQMPEYGAMAPKMMNKDGSYADLRAVPLGYKRLFLQCFVPRFDRKLGKNLHEDEHGVIEQSFLPGSFFICRTKALVKCKAFDPRVFLYREEEILSARMAAAGYKMGVNNRVYYRHDHDYDGETIKKIIQSHKLLFVSERYYFRRYLHADPIQMIYVIVFEYLGLGKYILRNLIKRKV